MLTFLVGGARSGKSTLAVQMGEHHGGSVHFIATAEAFDDDLRARIERHRAERPVTWTTAEVPVELGAALTAAPREALVIVDCLTVGPTVVVSNEVGMGVHPETPMGREYRDELGRVNQMVASAADRSLLLVAGRALRLGKPWELL